MIFFIFTESRGRLVSSTDIQHLGTLDVGVGSVLHYKPRGNGTEYIIVGTCQGRRRVYYDVDNNII